MDEDCRWQKVYGHGADGIPVSGDLGALVAAVGAGADIKISYARPTGATAVEWFRACPAVTVADDGAGT